MAIFKVEGGRRLHGEITPQGAKNEALQIICATLLTEEKVVVNNIPQILDIIQLIDLLQAMGVKVERLSEDSYSFCAKDINLDAHSLQEVDELDDIENLRDVIDDNLLLGEECSADNLQCLIFRTLRFDFARKTATAFNFENSHNIRIFTKGNTFCRESQ